jgi:hypothetical protein
MIITIKGEDYNTNFYEHTREKYILGHRVVEYVWHSIFAVIVDGKYYKNVWFEHVNEDWIKEKIGE